MNGLSRTFHLFYATLLYPPKSLDDSITFSCLFHAFLFLKFFFFVFFFFFWRISITFLCFFHVFLFFHFFESLFFVFLKGFKKTVSFNLSFSFSVFIDFFNLKLVFIKVLWHWPRFYFLRF